MKIKSLILNNSELALKKIWKWGLPNLNFFLYLCATILFPPIKIVSHPLFHLLHLRLLRMYILEKSPLPDVSLANIHNVNANWKR